MREYQIAALSRLLDADNVTFGTYTESDYRRGPDGHYTHVDIPLADVAYVHYSYRLDTLNGRPGWTIDTVPDNAIAILECTTYSDYSGSTCERANERAIADDCKGADWLKEMSGGHGTSGLAIDVRAWLECVSADDEDPCRVLETLEAIADYPVVSDDLLCEIEHEIETEYLPELYRDLARKVDWQRHSRLHDYLSEMPEDRAYACYRTACDETNTYPEFETGGQCYIRADRIWPVYLREAIARRHEPIAPPAV